MGKAGHKNTDGHNIVSIIARISSYLFQGVSTFFWAHSILLKIHFVGQITKLLKVS